MSGARGYVLIALLVGLLTLGLQALWRTDPTQRNLEIFTEMVYSKAAESFSENGVLPGGITQQPLVAGVVPRGELPLRYGPGTEEAQRMGRELANPLDPADGSHVDRGRELYGIYCTLCHGPGGDGQGKVTQRGVLPPPSLHSARARTLPDGELFHILTYGQGNMAAYAAQLSREERWQVVLHIRALQQSESP